MSQIFPGVQSGAAAAGKVLQFVYLEDSQSVSSGTVIPTDDTPPLITEGTQYTSKAITPMSDNSLLLVEFSGWGSDYSDANLVLALFVAGTSEALVSGIMSGATIPNSGSQSMRVVFQNNDLLNKTFTVRFGTTTAETTVKMLGFPSGGHIFGSAGKSLLTITEVAI